MVQSVRYEKSCGIIVVNNNKILLLHYPSGHWDFPKGHVDGSETEQETAQRELFEETAIEEFNFIDGFREATQYNYRRSRHLYQKKVVYFLGTTSIDSIQLSSEHQGFGWFAWRDAHQQITFENSKTILHAAERFWNSDACSA